MTPQQIKLIHTASSRAGLNRAQYELMLINVGGVSTCKALTHEAFEDCMAFLEDSGFPGTYWRERVNKRGGFANPRMVFKIRELHGQYEELRGDDDPHYELAGLVARASVTTTRDINALLPREAWNLIESLKKMIERLAPKQHLAPALTDQGGDLPF